MKTFITNLDVISLFDEYYQVQKQISTLEK